MGVSDGGVLDLVGVHREHSLLGDRASFGSDLYLLRRIFLTVFYFHVVLLVRQPDWTDTPGLWWLSQVAVDFILIFQVAEVFLISGGLDTVLF